MQVNPVFEVRRLLQTILVGGETEPPSEEAITLLGQLFQRYDVSAETGA